MRFDGKMLGTFKWLARRDSVLRDWVLQIGKVDGRLHVATKECRHDEWDPPVEPYGPYAPGKGHDVIIDEGDASHRSMRDGLHSRQSGCSKS